MYRSREHLFRQQETTGYLFRTKSGRAGERIGGRHEQTNANRLYFTIAGPKRRRRAPAGSVKGFFAEKIYRELTDTVETSYSLGSAPESNRVHVNARVCDATRGGDISRPAGVGPGDRRPLYPRSRSVARARAPAH